MDHYFGMHLLWWIFWVAMITLLFSYTTPVPRSKTRINPMEILQRRYAAGEISSEEYEERKAKLLRDVVTNA